MSCGHAKTADGALKRIWKELNNSVECGALPRHLESAIN